MFRIGVNPYGLAYTVGLQGAGTSRANPRGIGLAGFVSLALALKSQCVELDETWLRGLTPPDLARLREQLAGAGIEAGPTVIVSTGLTHQQGETLAAVIAAARAIGASLIRIGLTPVLEGSRAKWGMRWTELVAHARATLRQEAPPAAEAGIVLAIENHQDFGSEELVAMSVEAGDNVGIVLDTGNPFAVGEDPVEFTRRAAHRVRHVHLKDYRAQFTGEGYRLVRCTIGGGCVPLAEMAAVLRGHHASLTASLELGALEARHIRAFTPDWWSGYPPRDAIEFGTALGRLRHNCLRDDEDYRTPWEREAAGDELLAYEMQQIRASFENVRNAGTEATR